MVPFLMADDRPACHESSARLAALQARMNAALAGADDIDAKLGLLEDFVLIYGAIIELLRQSTDEDIRHKAKNAGQIVYNVQCCLHMVSARRAAA